MCVVKRRLKGGTYTNAQARLHHTGHAALIAMCLQTSEYNTNLKKSVLRQARAQGEGAVGEKLRW